jgi:hypothetical protein
MNIPEIVPVMDTLDVDDADAGEDTDERPPVDLSILQFSCNMFYVQEGEKVVHIDVVRLGDKSGTCKVDYYTKEASAKAGVKYKDTKGTLTFVSGQAGDFIDVEILEDSKFDTTLDFSMHLTNPEDAELGLYLHSCRIKINDNDTFPTNKYHSELRSHREHEISPWGLMLEYIRMNLHNPIIHKGTIKSLLADQLETFNYVWRVILMMFLVDNVLIAHTQMEGDLSSDDVGADSEAGAGDSCARRLKGTFGISAPKDAFLLVAILYISPMLLLHAMDIRQCHWKIGGTSRRIVTRESDSKISAL